MFIEYGTVSKRALPVPRRTNDEDLLRRAYGKVPEDIEEAACNTTLRRALIDHLYAGRPLAAGGGGCFLLPADFDWGVQVYRRQRFPWDGDPCIEGIKGEK